MDRDIPPHFLSDTWFVVFPDNEASSRLFSPLIPSLPRHVVHPSGRPWIAGNWVDDEFFAFNRGMASFAFVGFHAAREWSKQNGWSTVSDCAGLDGLLERLPGSFHFIASLGGECRVQGTASGLRRIFLDDYAPLPVVASRQDILNFLKIRPVHHHSVAGRLMFPQPPAGIEFQSPWKGISSVPAGSWIKLGASGQTSLHPWWKCPDAVATLAEGAPLLRERLAAAVDLAMACGNQVSADLSGGFDSTSLCFIGAQQSHPFLTFSSSGRENADDDLPWIDLARLSLPPGRHLHVPGDELPGPFDGIGDFAGVNVDEPYIGTAMWRRIDFTAKVLQRAGSNVHITGHGGDEVLLSPETYLYEWIRERPFAAARRLNQFRSKRRWTLIDVATAWAKAPTQQAYLEQVAKGIRLPFPDRPSASTSWGALEQRLPPWATDYTAELVRELLRQQIERGEPLHSSPAQHLCLSGIRSGAHSIRLTSQLMRQSGSRMAAPFLDDQVMEACLSVRHDEKTVPTSYKPLLSTAMKGVVPGALLERSTKPNFGIDVFKGRRRNAEELVSIAENLVLVKIGMVKKEPFRDACLGVGQPTPPIALWKTLACETWLRGSQDLANPE